MYNSSHFPVVIPFAWLPSVEGRDAKSARRLKGTNDIEVVADEDMVRPVDADIVSLILSVTRARARSLPQTKGIGLCVVRARPIAHPDAHQQHDEKVGHTDLMQGLHVLTC
jgi:hypothetical protein